MLVAFLTVLAAAPSSGPKLTTVAEDSGWTRTGRYAEVESLCAGFARAYPGRVKCEAFGKTPMGRTMWSLIASADGTFTPEQARARNRAVVLMQGGIHAGEIDGKDAGFWLLREVLEGRAAVGALAKVTWVFVPVFNVDGHERFGKNQRPNQRGPEEMGWRVTSQNLNLNRDYMKAEAPEMQAMLRLLNRFDPLVYVDLHVTDGAKFQHDVSISFEPRLTRTPAYNELGQGLHDVLMGQLTAKGHLPVDFYPSFVDNDDPASGFAYGWPPPRFANAYWLTHNRFGLLVETHSWKDYATRVKATRDVCELLLEQAATNGVAWRAAAEAADRDDAAHAGSSLTLAWDTAKTTRTIEFQGYEYTREPSAVSGKPWVRYDETRPQVWRVPFAGELTPAAAFDVPAHGWLVPPPHSQWIAQKLSLHGIAFKVLATEKQRVAVKTFRAQTTLRPGSFEGRQTVQVKGAWRDDVQDLPAGTLYVPAAQARVRVAMHLLEPTLPDSLTAWGFFNAHFEQKEYLEDYLTEAYARELLQDAGVKAEFEAKLKDEAFAKDPDARLRFFSSRHPSADPQLGLVPIYQATTPF